MRCGARVLAVVARRTLGCVGHIARQRARVCRPCHAPRRSGVGRGHAPHAWVCRPCCVLCAALGCVGGVGRVVWRARSCVSAVSHTMAPASRAVVVNVSCEEKRKKVKQKKKEKTKTKEKRRKKTKKGNKNKNKEKKRKEKKRKEKKRKATYGCCGGTSSLH